MAFDAQEAQSIHSGMTTMAGAGINAASGVVEGVLGVIGAVVGKTGDVEPEQEKGIEDVVFGDPEEEQYIDIPYYNRADFEKEAAKKGFELSHANNERSNLEYQKYATKDISNFDFQELINKYRSPRKNYILSNIEQETNIFRGEPVSELTGLDYPVANRVAKELNLEGISVRVDYNRSAQNYALRVLEKDEAALLEKYKETELFYKSPAGAFERERTLMKQEFNTDLKNIVDKVEKEGRMVLFDSENPEHIVEINKDGWREYRLDLDATGQEVDRRPLAHKIFEADYAASFVKSLEDISDRMGTARMVSVGRFEAMTLEQKMQAGQMTGRALLSEKKLTREGADLYRVFTLEKTPEGLTIVHQDSGFGEHEDHDRSAEDAAVSGVEDPDSLIVKEVEIKTSVELNHRFAEFDREYVKEDIEHSQELEKGDLEKEDLDPDPAHTVYDVNFLTSGDLSQDNSAGENKDIGEEELNFEDIFPEE